MGKQAAPADPTAGATRDAQIVGTFGYPSQDTTTSRKIERPPFWDQDWQGHAVFGRSQDTKTAPAGPNLTILLTFSSVLVLFTELLAKFWEGSLVYLSFAQSNDNVEGSQHLP